MKKASMPIEYIAAFILALALLIFAIVYFSTIKENMVEAVQSFFERFL